MATIRASIEIEVSCGGGSRNDDGLFEVIPDLGTALAFLQQRLSPEFTNGYFVGYRGYTIQPGTVYDSPAPTP